MIDFFTVLLLFPAYFLSLYTPRFALSFRPGRVYSLGFTAYVFAISLCKTVLDFRWQVYGTGQSASFLLSVVMSFTLPAAYHLCFGGDRYWRTGLILPFVCLQNLLLFPAFLPIMNLVAPLTWGLVLPIVGIFYLGMAYTPPSSPCWPCAGAAFCLKPCPGMSGPLWRWLPRWDTSS